MKFSTSYLAGLFDGEGCIFIARVQRKTRAQLLPSYMLRACINMVHRPLIDELASQLETSVIVHRKDLKNSKHRAAYEVYLHADRAKDFLLSIYDEMFVKKEEARLAIMFQEHIRHWAGRIPHMTVQEIEPLIAWREKIRLQVQACKRASFLGASDWNDGEFGGHPMPGLLGDAEGQYRAKQELTTPGVCNEHVPSPKGKICSALHGDMQNAAEMTASHKLKLVK